MKRLIFRVLFVTLLGLCLNVLAQQYKTRIQCWSTFDDHMAECNTYPEGPIKDLCVAEATNDFERCIWTACSYEYSQAKLECEMIPDGPIQDICFDDARVANLACRAETQSMY